MLRPSSTNEIAVSSHDVSIPNIYEKDDYNNILILEDFGSLRFDKILIDYPLKDLLKCAVETLTILKNNIDFNNSFDLSVYNYNTFKSEISELPNYYYSYISFLSFEFLTSDHSLYPAYASFHS